MSDDPCPFCRRIAAGDMGARNESAVAFPDAFPVSPGHTLVVPLRHAADLFDLDIAERRGVWDLVDVVRDALVADLAPDGFNVGVNVGVAAGQTVPHAHVHLIPRFAGDVEDPRGGVRWVIPAAAAYWNQRTE